MQSKTEQKAAPVLATFGFIPCQDFFPVTFQDKDGKEFRAKCDFFHPELNIYVEVKDKSLNSKTSKATADKAMARLDPARYAKSPTYFQCENQWNHSASKQAIVQHHLGPAQFMVVFTGKPDDATLKLIEKRGIDAYGLEKFSWYMLRRELSQY